MKKICFITTISGTLKSFVLETAIYLHNNTDWDITFVCDNDEEFAKILPDYIHYHPISMSRGISFDGVKAMFKMTSFFRKQKFDLIQYSTPNATLYASLAGWIAKIPVRLYCQWGIAYVGMSGIKRKIFKTIEKLNCTLSTWIEPDSFGNLDFCHDEGLYPKEKGSVIWNGSASGVSLEKFDISHKNEWRKEIRGKHNIPETASVFIFVGRITRDKGINELFEAWKKFENENATLFLVGRIENEKLLNQELFEWSKNTKTVIYTGVSNEVEKYLAASDVYILPSYREGFGSAVVEAEAMGVPVIVSDIPGPTDAMQKNITGYTVEKANSEDLYNKISEMFKNENIRKEMGKNAYEFAKQNFEQSTLFEKILLDRKKLMKE